MALVTRCPECATLFKVVPDQLRISEGWVRCGQCNEVFDASVDLHQQSTESITAGQLAPPTVSNAEPPAQTAAPMPTPAPQPWAEADGPDPLPLHLEFPDPPQLSQLASDTAHYREAYDVHEVGNTHGARDEGQASAPVVDATAFEPHMATSAEAALEAEFDRELLALEEESAAHGLADHQLRPEQNVGQSFADAPWRDNAGTDTAAPHENATVTADASWPAAERDERDVKAAQEEDQQHERDQDDDIADSDSVEPSVPDMPSMGEDAVFVAPFVSTAVDENAGASPDAVSAAKVSRFEPSPAFSAASGTSPSSDDYAFLRGAQARNSIWRKPAVRVGLVALAGVLLLALALQWLVVQREVVAAHWPQSRPFLVSVCEPLGCSVSALRRIDSIAIDSSAFTSLRRGAYRLNVVLKNRGPYPLAVPAIELALTDSQEQAVIRRVIPPHELGVSAEAIAANGELIAAVELAVPDNDAAARIVGYRLLAFYP